MNNMPYNQNDNNIQNNYIQNNPQYNQENNFQNNNVEENSKTSLKNNILAAAIIALSVMIIGISGSHAFFLNEVHEAPGSQNGLTVNSGELQLTFDTLSNKYINVSSAALMTETEALKSNNYTEFSVTLPSTAKISNAAYIFYLTEFSLTKNFKNAWVKWALFDVTNNEVSNLQLTSAVAKGNFNNVTFKNEPTAEPPTKSEASDYYLVSESPTAPDSSKYITINKGENGTTKKYRLYLWLENDDKQNQTVLLKGSLSAKVAFRGISKAS